jgi:hypothetical protein
MFFLRAAIIFWIVGFFLAFTLRGVIQLLSAFAVMLAQLIVQVFNGRHLT